MLRLVRLITSVLSFSAFASVAVTEHHRWITGVLFLLAIASATVGVVLRDRQQD